MVAGSTTPGKSTKFRTGTMIRPSSGPAVAEGSFAKEETSLLVGVSEGRD